jgi:hypothetical protein
MGWNRLMARLLWIMRIISNSNHSCFAWLRDLPRCFKNLSFGQLKQVVSLLWSSSFHQDQISCRYASMSESDSIVVWLAWPCWYWRQWRGSPCFWLAFWGAGDASGWVMGERDGRMSEVDVSCGKGLLEAEKGILAWQGRRGAVRRFTLEVWG